MPVMGGLELIGILRSDPGTTTIPILSVSSDWQLAVDADAALPKPYERADLLEITERLLKGRQDGQ
jgi:CheY-like chemotaxis protein